MSKQLFELMRMSELENEFPTKNQIKTQSANMIADVLEQGNHNPVELFSQAIRINEALSIITENLKQSLPRENFEAFGLKGIYSEGSITLNYVDDPIYYELQCQLRDREILLKTSYKSKNTIYDSDGIEIPKISSSPRKGSLRISF